MYKMIIVDDEKRARKGIKRNVDWEEYDIQIVGEAANGKKALKLIEEKEPELIITDIYMPSMDGLELIDKASEILPHAKAILISGYDDFQYAQTAIRNKAFDYILKPIEIDQLVKTVQKARDQVEKELEHIKNDEKIKKQLEESIPVLRERYLDHLLSGRLQLQDITEQYNYLKINLYQENFVVIVIQLNGFDNKEEPDRQTQLMGIRKTVEIIVNNDFNGEIITGYPDKITAIINYKNKNEIEKNLSKIQITCKKIMNSIEKYYHQVSTIGVGGFYKSADNIPNSYEDALEALQHQIFLGKRQIIYIGDVSIENTQLKLSYPIQIEEKLLTALKIGDIEHVNKYTKVFINYFLEKDNISPEQVKRFCFQLIYTVLKKLVEWNLSIELDNKTLEKHINQISSYKELKQILTDFMKKIVSKIKEKKQQQNYCYVQKACKYVENHYLEEIGLQEIANSVYITPQYLANIFKTETGKTVIDYLTEIRIKEAQKLLLETRLKIYEIGEKVGYSDSKYFSRVFKKYTDVSPNQYRNINS